MARKKTATPAVEQPGPPLVPVETQDYARTFFCERRDEHKALASGNDGDPETLRLAFHCYRNYQGDLECAESLRVALHLQHQFPEPLNLADRHNNLVKLAVHHIEESNGIALATLQKFARSRNLDPDKIAARNKAELHVLWKAIVATDEKGEPIKRGTRPTSAERRANVEKVVNELGKDTPVKKIVHSIPQRPQTTRKILRELKDEGKYTGVD